MKFIILAIGRAKAGHEKNLFQYYAKRIKYPLELVEVEVKRPLTSKQQKSLELKLLLSKVPDKGVIIALDEKGQQKTSSQFAHQIQEWHNDGVANLVFLIGGADGFDQEVWRYAKLVLSFGLQTWPHMLVRGLLVEQIYRSQCILSGHPYHRG